MSFESIQPQPQQRLLAWLPVCAGLLLFYIPTLIDLFNGTWNTDRNAHGPIVLIVAIWFLFFRIRQLLADQAIRYQPNFLLGWSLIGVGLIFYTLGRSQGLYLFEVGSIIPLLAGCLGMFFGARLIGRIWFAFFLMLFFIPLPASMVDAVTQPMKLGVSFATDHILYALGYPIARNGVILSMGQYQLLVADACAGLNSLFTLEALGLLYMNIVRRTSVLRNLTLAILIVPISFTANVIRVMALALITYYFGDAAGQGFLHGFASILLFCTSLLFIIGADQLICLILEAHRLQQVDRKISNSLHESTEPYSRVTTERLPSSLGPLPRKREAYRILGGNMKTAMGVGFFMLLTAAAARELTPSHYYSRGIPNFSKEIPAQFSDWKQVASPYIQIDLATRDEANTIDQPYDAILMRTYANSRGEHIMLALAYAREQRQDIKIHRPEVCYQAQGFSILADEAASFRGLFKNRIIEGTRFLAQNRDRREAVSYWIRTGDTFTNNPWKIRWYILREGFSGQIPDGVLVRVSSVFNAEISPDTLYKTHDQFLSSFIGSLAHPGNTSLFVPKSWQL